MEGGNVMLQHSGGGPPLTSIPQGHGKTGPLTRGGEVNRPHPNRTHGLYPSSSTEKESPKVSHLPGRLTLLSDSCSSPTISIEECSPRLGCGPPSPLSIPDLSSSPRHYGAMQEREPYRLSSLSPAREVGEDEGVHLARIPSPSSPLLTAVREAVDSLSQYEDFEILEKIGAGFFAEVFKVRHIPTDEVMVLKVNKRMNGIRKLKEVELLKRLHHPNILHYVGACIHEGQLHPLTEYVNGGTLEQLIQNQAQPFPWSLRLRLSRDVARGMDYLHKNGMLHRDLNSRNCLLRKQGSEYTAVVADFGLAAKSPNVIRTMTRTQSVVGSPYWMAPEVLSGKLYDEKADIFSYGIVLCEIISRLEADPDEIPRSRDYGLEREKFRELPQVKSSKCPEEFMELAFHCCRLLPLERPDFAGITVQLSVIKEAYSSQDELDVGASITLGPQPANRLSYHSMHCKSHSPSPTSPSPIESKGLETFV